MGKCLLFFFFILLTSCVSTNAIRIENLNKPINDLQKIVISGLPVGLRSQSTNGREFYSQYFVNKGGEFEAAEGEPTRFYAHILILNDRRPYWIEVYVRREVRTSKGGYVYQKDENGIANVLARRIRKTLYERREDRNIIDDFRAF